MTIIVKFLQLLKKVNYCFLEARLQMFWILKKKKKFLIISHIQQSRMELLF